jgi:hypothetical protein
VLGFDALGGRGGAGVAARFFTKQFARFTQSSLIAVCFGSWVGVSICIEPGEF